MIGFVCAAGVAVSVATGAMAVPSAGYLLKDAQRGTDYAALASHPDFRLTEQVERRGTAVVRRVRLAYSGEGDRAMTLAYDTVLPEGELVAFPEPDRVRRLRGVKKPVRAEERATLAGQKAFPRWPFLAVASGRTTRALGLTPGTAALYRLTFYPESRVLRMTYDLAFTPERPTADISFTEFSFDDAREYGCRGAWEAWMAIFPEGYRVRSRKHGGWMVGDALSSVPNREDFGVRYCERGAHKRLAESAAWNAANGIATFRYSSMGVWSMRFRINRAEATADMTLSNAVAEARAQSNQTWNAQAQHWQDDCMQDKDGNPAGKAIDYAWCRGWAWSVVTAHDSRSRIDHRAPDEAARFESLFGADARIPLDGEYCDSTDLSVMTELDYGRAHFTRVAAPLTWAADSFRPVVHKSFVGFDYLSYLSTNLHARGKMLMVNAAPKYWAWIPPLCDVLGTEANWGMKGAWTPYSRDQLLFRRTQCGAKPFCIVQNTEFGPFGAHVEKYLQLCLAYGFLPGFFAPGSANDKRHYFMNPEFYERDRALCRKYMPLCSRVSEAGWRPVNRLLPVAKGDLSAEQFGDRFVTLYNFGTEPCRVVLPRAARELVSDERVADEVEVSPQTCRVLDFGADRNSSAAFQGFKANELNRKKGIE